MTTKFVCTIKFSDHEKTLNRNDVAWTAKTSKITKQFLCSPCNVVTIMNFCLIRKCYSANKFCCHEYLLYFLTVLQCANNNR